MERDSYSQFLVKTEKTAKEVDLVFRLCPFCGEAVYDRKGTAHGFEAHINLTIEEHKKNRYWNKLQTEKEV